MRALRPCLTLLEVLLAALVLSVGLLGLLGAIPGLARTGNQAALDVLIDEQAASAWAALRTGARDGLHVEWTVDPPGPDGVVHRRPAQVWISFPHPAARPTDPPADPLGSPDCLVLPWASDAVLLYPRAGDPAAVAAANAALAPAGERPAALYLLPGADPLEAGLGFAVRVQRARVAGRARNGLYLVALQFFRVPPGGEAEPDSWTALHTFASELAAGPSDALLPSPAAVDEVSDPRDWQDTLRWQATR